jgi:hypothetical protein
MARVSEYGIKWDARVPRGDVAWYIGRLHCGTPDEEIAADIRKRCTKGYTAALIEQTVRYALLCHARNRGLYRDVVSGRV